MLKRFAIQLIFNNQGELHPFCEGSACFIAPYFIVINTSIYMVIELFSLCTWKFIIEEPMQFANNRHNVNRSYFFLLRSYHILKVITFLFVSIPPQVDSSYMIPSYVIFLILFPMIFYYYRICLKIVLTIWRELAILL